VSNSNPEQELIVVPPRDGAPEETQPEDGGGEAVHHPSKVMRIGGMVKQLLDEVRAAPLDEASRSRLKEIYETSVKELAQVLSPDLQEELARLHLPFDDEGIPSDAELRVAHAQLVGWLEGLFHGIQAMLFAQQMQQGQLQDQRRGLPRPDQPGAGTYL